MTSNRVHNYIKRILQNSKLNRVNSIKNRINYSIVNAKNRINNKIIRRNISTLNCKEYNYSTFCGSAGAGGGGSAGGGGFRPNNYFGLFALAIGCYVGKGKFNQK